MSKENKYYYWLYCADKQLCAALNTVELVETDRKIPLTELTKAWDRLDEAEACLEYVRQLLGYSSQANATRYGDRHNKPNVVHAIDTFINSMENGSDAV